MTAFLPDLDLTGTGFCASFNFRRAARAMTTLFDHALQDSGIRSTQFTILTCIAKAQPVSVGKVSDTLVMDATTLTRNLSLLRKQGLVTVSPRGTMRRRFVSLTAQGEKALARAVPLWREIQQKFVKQIGEDAWMTLRSELESLSKLAVSMEKGETASQQSPQPEAPQNEAR
ncbi:MAG: oxidation-sensing regulator MosR [Candidatus Acidiferrum sp.]